jgi:hypothetical protein
LPAFSLKPAAVEKNQNILIANMLCSDDSCPNNGTGFAFQVGFGITIQWSAGLGIFSHQKSLTYPRHCLLMGSRTEIFSLPRLKMNTRMHHIMNKPFTPFFLRALAVGAVVLLAQNAHSQGVVYNNTTTYQNANFDFGSGISVGNEVVLAGTATSDTISSFSFQFDLTGTAAFTGSEDVDVVFYQNNGSLVNSAASPSTVLWNSGTSTLASLGLTAYTTGSSLTYSVPDVTVPQDFTWTVTFSSFQAGDQAGLALYGPATVGENYADAWVETGGVWALDVASGSNPALKFGAEITAVPEPGTIALGLMGVSAFLVSRRKK